MLRVETSNEPSGGVENVDATGLALEIVRDRNAKKIAGGIGVVFIDISVALTIYTGV